MKLVTKVLKGNPGQVPVAWRVGTKRKGIVTVFSEGGDFEQTAELLAIRYLLFTKCVFKRVITTGTGVCLEVSSPSIPRIAAGKATDSSLRRFAPIFVSRLAGVAFSNTDPADPYLPTLEDSVDHENISAFETEDYEVFQTPAMGAVRLSKNAVDSFIAEMHSGMPHNPVRSLIDRLMHRSIKRETLPPRVLAQKAKKYGCVDTTEIWGHASSQMHYVIVRDVRNGVGTVIDVYRRHQEYLV